MPSPNYLSVPLLSALLLCGPWAVPAGAIEWSLGQVSGLPGQEVVLPIVASEADGLVAADLTLAFDPGVAAVSAVRTGAATTGFLVESTVNWGRVDLGLASAEPLASGGEVATVVFRLLDNAAPGASPVEVRSVTWYRADFSSGDPDPAPQAGALDVGGDTGSSGGGGGGGGGGGCFLQQL